MQLASGPQPTQMHQASPTLPDEPFITIEPSTSWVAIRLGDLWEYRELLYFLIWRDVKVRYKQTLLGTVWTVLQPLLATLIFTVFFGILAGVKTDGVPYPIFAFSGLMIWTFFANAVIKSSNSLVGSAQLITKVYFPRLLIPVAAVGTGLVDLAISFVVLLAMMIYYHVAITWNILLLPVLILLVMLFALGVGLWLSAMNVKYRDVGQLVPFLIQMWMFASPVIFPPTLVPEKWRWLLILNPLTGLIDGFRASVLGRGGFYGPALALSCAVTIALLVYSAYSFRRMEKTFADLV